MTSVHEATLAKAAHPLRFGVMCPAGGLTAFARKCIANITRDGIAEPVLLIVDESETAPSSIRTKIQKSLQLDGNLWYFQSKLFPLSRIDDYQTQPLEECLPGIRRLTCQPELKGKWSQYFKATDVAEIRTHNLDFILKFAFGITRGDILQTARYGVWSFHHDDEEKYRGGPPGFWEIYRGDPVTGALLQRLTDRLDGGVVLKKCSVPTDGSSYRANLQRILESSWHMVRWVCLDVLEGRLTALEAAPSKTGAPIYHAPNDPQMLRFWIRLVENWFLYKLANQRIDEWNVGIVNAPQTSFLEEGFRPVISWSAYKEHGQMVADPFVIPASEILGDEGPPRILVEELNWSTEKGRISELRGKGAATTITPVIDEGAHMSYPYAFSSDGAIYAIPETGELRSILLYRLDERTGAWRRQAVLIENVDAVDATVFEYEGRWWLMHSGTTGVAPWSLYLWHAPSLLGPWSPHAANPVKMDVSSSRPAGNPFWRDGFLYRPAQDGRLSYGGALCINRIDELSLSSFRETVVRRIAPDPQGPYPDGLHTLSGHGNVTVVDGKRHTWPVGLLLRRKLAKRLGFRLPGFAYVNVSLAKPAALRDNPSQVGQKSF